MEQKAEKAEADVKNLASASTLYAKAEQVAKDAEAAFQQKLSKEKDGEWFLTMIKKGTASDKVSALSMLIQRNPKATISYVMQLLGIAKKLNRKLSEQAVVAIKDLFLRRYLVPNKETRKLAMFSRNPVIIHKHASCSDEELLDAYYDHCLRLILRDFLTNVL